MATKWEPTSKQTAAILGVCGLVLVGSVVGASLLEGGQPAGNGGGSSSTYTPPDVADSSQVEKVCHDRASDLLKAPSTADFGGDTVSGYEPNYTDVGYVDAQNGFGAQIRTNYTCTAIHGTGINFQVKVTFLN